MAALSQLQHPNLAAIISYAADKSDFQISYNLLPSCKPLSTFLRGEEWRGSPLRHSASAAAPACRADARVLQLQHAGQMHVCCSNAMLGRLPAISEADRLVCPDIRRQASSSSHKCGGRGMRDPRAGLVCSSLMTCLPPRILSSRTPPLPPLCRRQHSGERGHQGGGRLPASCEGASEGGAGSGPSAGLPPLARRRSRHAAERERDAGQGEWVETREGERGERGERESASSVALPPAPFLWM